MLKIGVQAISYSLKAKKDYSMCNIKWNSLECDYNINLKEFLSMDIELQSQKQHSLRLFQFISPTAASLVQQQKIILENTFKSDPNQSCYDLKLTLVNTHIILSFLACSTLQPNTAVEISFDLKFEVLYYEEKNVRSQKIGIRLFHQDQNSFSLFSANSAILDAWIWCLSRRINQKGFHEMFKPSKKLGKGNFASVYQVERLTDGKKFAVKAFSKQTAFSAKNGKESLINQLNTMRLLNQQSHPNILKLQGVFQSDNSIYVVLELLTGGQLFHRIQSCSCNFTAEQIREFMLGLLKGISHMHSFRIMHRDLKPENIMLRSNESMIPVIVDFGLATNADFQKYLFFRCGTPGYVAPEIICLNQSKHIEPECDMFSAGVIFHILLTRKAVFQGSRYQEVYSKNKQLNIDFENQRYNNLNPLALDLLKKMLILDPKNRIKASQALSHPYLQTNQTSESALKLSSPCLTASSKRLHGLVSKK